MSHIASNGSPTVGGAAAEFDADGNPIIRSPLNGAILPRERQYGQPNANPSNPGGKPKILSRIAVEELLKDPELCRDIVKTWLAQAKRGGIKSRNQLLERTEGKVPQESHGEVQVTHTVIVYEKTDE